MDVGQSSTANRTLERQLKTQYDFYEFTQEIPSIRIMSECEKLVKMTDDELNELVGNFSKKECQAFIMGTLKGIATSLSILVGKATIIGRTFLTHFAIYRYFIGTIGKLKVYQY